MLEQLAWVLRRINCFPLERRHMAKRAPTTLVRAEKELPESEVGNLAKATHEGMGVLDLVVERAQHASDAPLLVEWGYQELEVPDLPGTDVRHSGPRLNR